MDIVYVLGVIFTGFLSGVGLGYKIGYDVALSISPIIKIKTKCSKKYPPSANSDNNIELTEFSKKGIRINIQCPYLQLNKKCLIDSDECPYC